MQDLLSDGFQVLSQLEQRVVVGHRTVAQHLPHFLGLDVRAPYYGFDEHLDGYVGRQAEALGEAAAHVGSQEVGRVLRPLRLLEQLAHGEHELGPGDLDRLRLEHRLTQPASAEPRVHDEALEEL
jgi:hypothetical protein